MPLAHVNGIELYYEESGQGFPLVLSHEFAGDARSWALQVQYFSSKYRVVTYNQRGYPPSSVPNDAAAYTNEQLVEDLYQLLRALGINRAHIAGLAMGANVALHLAIEHPAVVASLILGGCGTGTVNREAFVSRTESLAEALEREGIGALIGEMQEAPARLILREKDPRRWDEFLTHVADHSASASAHLLRGVLLRRKTIAELRLTLETLCVPTLILVGDRDEPCIEPSLFLRRHLPLSSLGIIPRSGHTLNTEEPDVVNLLMDRFLSAVEAGHLAPSSAAPLSAR